MEILVSEMSLSKISISSDTKRIEYESVIASSECGYNRDFVIIDRIGFDRATSQEDTYELK
jgi:hypothetical protein